MDLRLDPPLTFQDRPVPKDTRLAGWAALVHGLGIGAPVKTPSAVADGYMKRSQRSEDGWTVFDKRYWPGESITDHLGFALRHEPIDLLILKRAFAVVPAEEITAFIKAAPTGALTRRAWFFYERLQDTTLDIDDAQTVSATKALDPEKYFTGAPRLSKRHRVRDNLLGTGDYCPIIRRTEALEAFLARGLDAKAAERRFTPAGMVFPVSSVMLDRIEDYRNTLQGHSRPLMQFIEWRPTPNRNVEVTNDTADLYRYFDCTEEAELLYGCVARTVEHDLPQEIDFLRRQDEAERRIMEVVEMPDRLAQDLIMFMRQNGGTIPKRRRENEFAALTDDEAKRVEAIYGEVLGARIPR